ncbi:MAG: hypothetical protein LH614_03660 [Pyrinomonadaceae bacterium]|nr:hypothetical protein [Pyrinomonadaceae bacterium]
MNESAKNEPPPRATFEQLAQIFQYIKENWQILSRSNKDLAKSAADPKFFSQTERAFVYIPRSENFQAVAAKIEREMSAEDFARIELRVLRNDPSQIKDHGLVYLPEPYIVPGGRFNEMYGWDSYFIVLGLLRDGEIELAQGMTDNLLYEIEHYGKILNANRTYYLTRSQPPFISSMVRDVYRETGDKKWLKRAAALIEKTCDWWNSEPHLTRETELSRYYSDDPTPAPEVVADEKDANGKTHYDRVREFYKNNEVADYDVSRYYNFQTDELTPLFYIGDRSMRESGFDPSNRFGQFNVDIINYNPVCLNSLLYQMEIDTAKISRELGDNDAAQKWETRAQTRAENINRMLWDEKDGFYYDLNFNSKNFRRYPFLTTFYPLWGGIADKKQAHRLVENLKIFEQSGGLQTSPFKTGSQWDAPFGWSPLELIAVEGLRKYGYEREANRITVNFLSLILKEFLRTKTIVEKYDVVRRASEVAGDIKFGYDYNVVGFGWTNGAFLKLYDALPDAEKSKVLDLNGIEIP